MLNNDLNVPGAIIPYAPSSDNQRALAAEGQEARGLAQSPAYHLTSTARPEATVPLTNKDLFIELLAVFFSPNGIANCSHHSAKVEKILGS